MLVLGGDLGGTKTLLQIAEFNGVKYRILHQEHFISSHFENLEPMLNVFLGMLPANLSSQITSACFAVAGPVDNNIAHITNLNWHIDAMQLAKRLQIRQIKLVNDFYAIAAAIDVLNDDDLYVLQGTINRQNGNRAILGAGTGLGTAIQIWNGEYYHIVPTEGGHISFAPGDKIELELLEFLYDKQQQVSYENILSGSGIEKIYQYLLHKSTREDTLKSLMTGQDGAKVISDYGLNHQNDLARQTLELFVKIYGRQAGNLALTCLAYGGVYIAGGIAAKNIEIFKNGSFVKAFNNNTQMGHLLKNMPVYIITNTNVGLIGAAYIASQLN